MNLKKLAILFFTAIFGLAVILILSAHYWDSGNQKTQTDGKDILTVQTVNISETCHKIEYKIRNSEINKILIEDELNKLNSIFERNYLSALLKIREGDYIQAYQLLFNHLDENILYFSFYDELVISAKITNNLVQLNNWLQGRKEDSPGSLYLSALIKFENGNYRQSVKEFEKIINNNFTAQEVLYKLAYAFRLIGDYEKSFNWFDKLEVQLSEDDRFLAKVLNGKGSIYFLSGEYEAAEKYYTDAYNSAVKTGNTVEKIKATGNLAIIKDSYGDVYSAREDLLLAIEKSKKIENRQLLAFLYSELGVSYTYTNEILEARKNYELSYEYYSTLKDRERLSYLSANIGSIFLQEANYKLALKYYKEGLGHSAENKLGQILNLTGIADVYSNSSNYSKAIEYYNKAHQLADSIQSVTSLIKIEQGLGALFFNVNKPNKALDFLMKAKALVNDKEYPFETTELYYKIGTVLASIDSLGEAVKYFEDGLQIALQMGDLYNEIILNTELAHTYYLQKKIVEAIKHLNKGSELAKEYELTQLMGLQELYFGKIRYVQNKFAEAHHHFDNSFLLSENASDYNTQIEAGYNLAQLSIINGDQRNAENWFNKSITIIENISISLNQNQEIQITHFTGFNEIYNSLITFYLSEEKDTEAFEILERSRSRNTMQNLVNLKLISSINDESMLNKFIDLNWMVKSDLYTSEEKISLRNELQILKDNFVEKDPQLARFLFSSPWKSIEEIKSNLKDDDNLISVFTAEDKTSLFHLTSRELKVYTFDIGKKDVNKLLEAIAPIYKSDLASDEIYINQDLFSFNAEAAWNFYRNIFKNVLETIPAEETIIFCFADKLLLLPAELLVTEWKEGDSPFYYNDKKFLVEKYLVLYTPSASIYITQLQKEASQNKFNLLVGNPKINNDEFTISYRSGLLSDDDYSSRNAQLFPLAYSDEEIENIDNIISGNVVLVSDDATEENFKANASASNLIHLSTHSFLFKNQPFIILSSNTGEADDGYLEVSEIIQLHLNSDLVVLSSCRSGLGRIDQAEGIIGMQKAFFEAGANSIVVSLWDVNDKYTSFFMKDFYDHLSQGLNKPNALRKAKLGFIKKYSANPYYWSAFVLSGNPSKMNLQTASLINPLYILIVLFALSYLFFIFRKSKRR